MLSKRRQASRSSARHIDDVAHQGAEDLASHRPLRRRDHTTILHSIQKIDALRPLLIRKLD
jgi:chromosomal replication initiation ATPase DnaA